MTRVQQRAEQLIVSHHYDAAAVQSMVRTLQERLEHTLMCAEDRQKLATSSATFFFTVDQVRFVELLLFEFSLSYLSFVVFGFESCQQNHRFSLHSECSSSMNVLILVPVVYISSLIAIEVLAEWLRMQNSSFLLILKSFTVLDLKPHYLLRYGQEGNRLSFSARFVTILNSISHSKCVVHVWGGVENMQIPGLQCNALRMLTEVFDDIVL